MPINVYTGLMRSGKSFEVVSEVILPAVRSGRRVVTNVDGISQDLIHEYLAKRHVDDDHDAYGLIVHVDNAQVFLEDFFPYYDDQKGAHTDTVVQPGDLVAIDEAWRFWGSSMKLHKHHKSFFLEHGHFIHPDTRIACDLVLMIQDMSTLNRFVKTVVAFHFRTHKKVALGMSNTYSVQMWEGHKQTRAALLSTSVRKYHKDIFPLYSSFKGGGAGVLVNADARQNILGNKKLWMTCLSMLLAAVVCVYTLVRFFSPAKRGVDKESAAVATSAAAHAGVAPASASPLAVVARQSVPEFSQVWRLAGSYTAQGKSWVVLVDSSGRTRLESPSVFQNSGLVQIGEVDGARVGAFTGSVSAPQPTTLGQK